MTVLHVTNGASVVSDEQVARMTLAVNRQLERDVAPNWRVQTVPVRFAGRRARPRPGDWVITVVDDPDTSGDAGWHSEKRGGVIYGRVFAKPCLAHLDPDPNRSVGPTLSHEAIETLLDPNCSYWADSRAGFLVAHEACDPVEDGSYRIGRVSVSNFVLPAYFDPDAPAGCRLDYLRQLRRPFQLSKGGYWMQRKGTRTVQRTAEEFPDWKKPLKNAPGSRPSRRTRSSPRAGR